LRSLATQLILHSYRVLLTLSTYIPVDTTPKTDKKTSKTRPKFPNSTNSLTIITTMRVCCGLRG